MAPYRRFLYRTMSNPNTNALMSMLQNLVRTDNCPTAARFKTAYVRKYRFPITLLNMVSIDDDAWKKCASFDSFASSIRGQMDVHSSLDLVTVIAGEISIDATPACIDSKVVKQYIMSNMMKIKDLP